MIKKLNLIKKIVIILLVFNTIFINSMDQKYTIKKIDLKDKEFYSESRLAKTIIDYEEPFATESHLANAMFNKGFTKELLKLIAQYADNYSLVRKIFPEDYGYFPYNSERYHKINLAFFKYDDLLALSAGYRFIRLLDLKSYKTVRALKGHLADDIITENLEFSPDGKYLASQSRDKIILRLFKTKEAIATLKLLQTSSCPELCFAFSPDSKYLAHNLNSSIRIFDIDNNKYIYSFDLISNERIRRIKYSPCGQYIAALMDCSSEPKIKIFDLQTKLIKTGFNLKSDRFKDIVFSKDSNYLIVSGYISYADMEYYRKISPQSPLLKMWDLKTNNCIYSLNLANDKNISNIHSIKSLNGNNLLMLTENYNCIKNVTIFDINTLTFSNYGSVSESTEKLANSDCGKFLATVLDGKEIDILKSNYFNLLAPITSCAYCLKEESKEHKNQKCTCGKVYYCSNRCRKNDRSRHKEFCKKTLINLNNHVTYLSDAISTPGFSFNLQKNIGQYADEHVLHASLDRRQIADLKKINEMTFTPDSKFLAFHLAYPEDLLKIINMNTLKYTTNQGFGKDSGELKEINKYTECGKYLINNLCAIEKEQLMMEILKKNKPEYYLEDVFSIFSPYVISSCCNYFCYHKKSKDINSISICSVKSPDTYFDLNLKKGMSVQALAYSDYEDNKLLAVALDNVTVIIWNLSSLLNNLEQNSCINKVSGLPFYFASDNLREIKSLKFSPNGRYLASYSASPKNLIKIFDLKSRSYTSTIETNGIVNSMTFSPDGQFLIVVTEVKKLTIWDLNINKPVFYKEEKEGAVTAITYSLNGQYLAAASCSYQGQDRRYPFGPHGVNGQSYDFPAKINIYKRRMHELLSPINNCAYCNKPLTYKKTKFGNLFYCGQKCHKKHKLVEAMDNSTCKKLCSGSGQAQKKLRSYKDELLSRSR